MLSPHVPVDPELRLPRHYAYVEDYLRVHDGALRLRRSLDQPGFYVVERRVSRSKPVHTSLYSDAMVAARDGYVHVSHVHPWFMERPARIIAKLRGDQNDLWREGGARQLDATLRRQEHDARVERREKRRAWARDVASEAFDALDRLGGIGGTERTRLNNAGLPAQTSLRGDPGITEDSHVNQPATSSRAEDGELSHHAAHGPA